MISPTARTREALQQVVLALDPGPTITGWVLFDGSRVLESGTSSNASIEVKVSLHDGPVCCEWIECFGMAVGADVFRTCYQVGRFAVCAGEFHEVTRRQVKLELCNSARAKDGNIRQALLDRVGPVGTKANRGPCYGVSKHAWSALAVAVVWLAQQQQPHGTVAVQEGR